MSLSDEARKDASRPFYERKAGEIAIFIDVFDAEPSNDEPIGSRQYFMKNLNERFCEQLQKQELFKIKGFFEKRGLLREVSLEYITNESGWNLMVLCTNNIEAVATTKKEYQSGRLLRCVIECFGTEALQKRLEVKGMKIKIKIWDDEFEMTRQEWAAGKLPEKYDLQKNDKSLRMIRYLKRYQHQKIGGEKGIVAILKEAEFQFEQTFADFVLCLKKNKPDTLVPFNKLNELQSILDDLNARKEPDAKLVAHYLDTVALISRLIREVETNVWFPISQIRVGGENPRQIEQRRLVRQLVADVKAAVKENHQLNGQEALRDQTWSSKITASERRLCEGVVCFLPVLIHKILDVDQAIDDYFQVGGIVIKMSELGISS